MDLKKWDLSNVNLGNLTDDERREIHALMTRDQQEQNELGAGLVILYVCSIPPTTLPAKRERATYSDRRHPRVPGEFHRREPKA